MAYRSRPRPSSAPGAKASTACPYYLDGINTSRIQRSVLDADIGQLCSFQGPLEERLALKPLRAKRRSLKTEQYAGSKRATPMFRRHSRKPVAIDRR